MSEHNASAPKVTLELVNSLIVEEYYFTAQQGNHGHQLQNKYADEVVDGHESLGLLTFCVLVLKNGFTVSGESACASPENFNPITGETVARANAVSKIWPLEGYLLKELLSKATV